MEGFTAGAWANWRRSPSAMSPDSHSGSEPLRQGKIPVIGGSGETSPEGLRPPRTTRCWHCSWFTALTMPQTPRQLRLWWKIPSVFVSGVVSNSSLHTSVSIRCPASGPGTTSSQEPVGIRLRAQQWAGQGRAGQDPIPDNQRPLLFTGDQKEQEGLKFTSHVSWPELEH